VLFVWLRGLAMGFSMAAPVGPIGVLCIRRTLTQGRLAGFVSGCGAATADAFYGLVAVFGLTAFSNLLVNHKHYLQVVGGLFLCYLGLKTFFSKSTPKAYASVSQSLSTAERSQSLMLAYTSTLALTLTNPATILSFATIFAAFGITQGDYLQSSTFVFGVFSGSLLWWLMLVSGMAYLSERLTAQRLAKINNFSGKVFGSVIFIFGMAALITAF